MSVYVYEEKNISSGSFAIPCSDNMWIAYTIFFSSWDCKKVINDGRITIGGNTVNVKRKGARRPHEDVPLPVHKAQDLLTYYFGFNCWTSEVVYVSA